MHRPPALARRRLAVVTFALLATTTVAVQGQDPEILQGRVVDTQTMGPVVRAFVAQVGSQRGVVTDSMGRFALPMDSGLARAIRVVQFGYRELQTSVPTGGEGRVLNVLLVPDPIQLDGLTVLTERLADRRRGIFGVADILLQEQLMTASEGSGYDLVRRMLPFVELCDRQNSEALCMGGRLGAGGKRQVTVCIDGSVVPPELAQTILSGVDPRGLYMVEVYSRVGEVRMYSPGYMQRLIETDMDLPPLSFGCSGAGG